MPYWPIVPRLVSDPLKKLTIGLETERALHSVAIFLCFFVPKPPTYKEEIAEFKQFFIPNFAAERDKQRLLLKSVLPRFSMFSFEEAAREWRVESMYEFINPENRFEWEGKFRQADR